jgi:AraC-like DNA-binding protein
MFSDAMGSKSQQLSRPRFVNLATLNEATEGPVGSEDAATFFIFLVRGTGVVRIQDTGWPLLRGAACIACQQPEILGPVLRGWTLSIDWDHVGAGSGLSSTGEGVRVLPAGVATRCEGFFEALEAELDRGEDLVDSSAVHALVQLILLCYERSPHTGRDLESPSDEGDRRARLLVSQIREVIDGRYAERLSLADVATALNRSSSSLARAARTVTGRSVLELIAERRIDEARRLLTESALSISDIAAQVGYPNAGHFHRAFRRNTSLTPRAWRVEAARAIERMVK